MKPRFWRVTWEPMGAERGGFIDFPCRPQCRGFAILRRAAGFTVHIQPKFNGAPQRLPVGRV